MKKILMFFLLMASISSFSQESLTIDEALSRVGNNRESYEFKSFENTKEATDIRIKDNKLGDFNGVTISSSYNITENNFEDRDRKYDKTFQNKASYGPFFVNYNFVERDRSYVSYGVEKNLKDVFYSKYKSNIKVYDYQQELNKISYDKTIENKKINLVNLYNELEAEDSKLQIDILETKLKSLYEIGKTDYNIDFENYKLVDFIDNNESIEKLLASYMEKDIAELKLNLSVAEERKKYSNYDRHMPDLYLAYERVDRNLRGDRYYRDQDIFSIRFSKKLFSTDSDYKLSELEVENLKNDLNEKIRVINAEKIKLKAEYYELSKLLSIASKKSQLAYKKYLIKEKEYELSRASYLDVIDEYNKYLSLEIENKRAKNTLNSFIYKLKIKG